MFNYLNPAEVRLTTALAGADGAYANNSGASVKLSAKTKNGLTAVFITASAGDGTFIPEESIKIGYKFNNVESGMADFLYSEYWCCPEFFGADCKFPARSQAALFRLTDGTFYFMLSLCGDTYKCTLGGDKHIVTAALGSFTGTLSDCLDQPAFIAGKGSDPYKLISDCAHYAEEILGGSCKTIEKKKYPEIFDYLGWCTWDAMHVHVNEEGVREKLAEFKEKNVPMRWALIDDMWADVPGISDLPKDIEFGPMIQAMHRSSLNSYDADSKRFPNGLGGCIDDIHKAGLKAGVWYPATGYWFGFMPDGEVAREYADCMVTLPQRGNRIGVSPDCPEKPSRFFCGVAEKIKSYGTDFIKIDNQSCYRSFYLNCGIPVGVAAKNMQTAIQESAEKYFDGAIINCMGMSNEAMFNRGDSAVSRCSNDFTPNDRAWFTHHITQCAYNSLIQGQFYYNDWDMWWTGDPQAKKNSVCRAISGGPIYVSDRIGETDPEILRPLCFDDGKIIRTDLPAVPTPSCLTSDPRVNSQPMMIFSKKNGCTVVAAFNIDKNDRAVSGRFNIKEFGMDKVVVREYFSGKLVEVDKDGYVAVDLATPDEFTLYVLAPIEKGISYFGMTDKFISPGTFERVDGGVRTLCDGKFALYVAENAAVTLNGADIGKVGYVLVDVKSGDIISVK